MDDNAPRRSTVLRGMAVEGWVAAAVMFINLWASRDELSLWQFVAFIFVAAYCAHMGIHCWYQARSKI
jgi:hypothetical protein